MSVSARCLLISVLPDVPTLQLRPGVIFFGFLPPLVYWAAFVASPEEFAANWESIGLLAVGLVLASTAAVALVVWAVVPGLGLAPAFVLGAVVAPTDPVAAGEVIKRVGAPHRITTVLEGESLINDGVALVLYGLAIAATRSGSFSFLHGFSQFLEDVAISVAVGLGIGAVTRLLRKRIEDADAQIVLSLVTPYVAYIAADRAGASGVLATVTAGLYVGWRTSGVVPATTRLRANTFWDVLVYLLNAVLFLMLGAQFTSVIAGLGRYSAWALAGYAGAAAGTAIVLRLAWMLLVPPATARIHALGRRDVGLAPLSQRLLMGWSGMRGAVSLAAALSIPLVIDNHAFPDRSLLVFVTFCVILATLVFQGGTLPWVIRLLGVSGDHQSRSEALARHRLAQTALARLDEIAGDPTEPTLQAGEDARYGALGPLREIYQERQARAARQIGGNPGSDIAAGSDSAQRRGLFIDSAWRDVIRAQRSELIRLRRTSQIDHATMRRLLRELDLEEARRPD